MGQDSFACFERSYKYEKYSFIYLFIYLHYLFIYLFLIVQLSLRPNNVTIILNLATHFYAI